MTARLVALFVAILATAGPGRAEIPSVVADMPATHSLVARVMDGVGRPELLIRPGASPHGHAMRPSEAASLQSADLVVWIGPALTPWLERAIRQVAEDARSLRLLDADGTRLLDRRVDAHDHAHAEGVDPHAWLDPENAAAWLPAIAGELAALDPEHAEIYRRNAAEARAELAQLGAETAGRLAPLGDIPFVVSHDAFRYFEDRFGLGVAAAIADTEAAAPGPARLEAVRETVARTGAACVILEPQADLRLARLVAGDADLAHVEADPTGAELEPGPSLYPQLIRSLADAFVTCLE